MTDIKTKVAFFLFLVSLAVLIGGCEEYPDPALIEEQQATLKGIKNAIQYYHSSNEKYPENIREIQKLTGTPIDPDTYQYNPENGMVKLKER